MLRRAVLFLVLAAAPAEAGVLTCRFTEPFFDVVFDSAIGSVVRISADDSDPVTGKPIPKAIAGHARLVLADGWEGSPKALLQDGDEILLELSMEQGSDGMSDIVFPMSGRFGDHVGGCETDKVPAFDLYELYGDLGIPF